MILLLTQCINCFCWPAGETGGFAQFFSPLRRIDPADFITDKDHLIISYEDHTIAECL